MSATDTKTDAIPMTDEQKFFFDLKGWLLLPAVLSDDEIAACREHAHKVRFEKDSLPEMMRHPQTGPLAELLDHPAIVGILRTIIAEDRTPDCYGFRCESSFIMHRTNDGGKGLAPHGGGPGTGPLKYRFEYGAIRSPFTRVAWEFNEVKYKQGGTLLMSGSHKANFHVPRHYSETDMSLFETYACPPGSVLIFSESVCHAGDTWTNADNDRLAMFNCYNHTMCQYHKMNLPAEVVEAMPPKRRTLFRGVWGHDFSIGQPNDYYSPDNQAL